MKSTGQVVPDKKRHEALVPLAQITDHINDAELGIQALFDLLSKTDDTVSARSIARLLKPHLDALRSATGDLDDHF